MEKVSRKVQRTADEGERARDLARYVELALKLGAANATVVDVEQIPVEERVVLKCQVPRCISYGVCAHCPPHTLKPADLREALKAYKKALLFNTDLPAEVMGINGETFDELKSGYLKVNSIVNAVESRAFYDGHYLAVGFAAGSCRHTLCVNKETCTALQGEPCQHFFKARPSMEAVGIDVFRMVAEAGWEIFPIGADATLSKIPKGTMAGLVVIY